MESRKALVIGINDYPDDALSGCEADATAVGDVLEKPPYSYGVRRLLNHEATRRNVLRALQDVLAEADAVIVYFAGHGVTNDLGTYLATIDGTEEDEGVDVEHLRRLIEIKAARSKLVLLILDCCHSGAAKPRGRQRASGAQFSRSMPLAAEGRVLLAACRAEEVAFETADGAHGEFTQCLLEALAGDAANAAGSITLFSLHEYIAKRFETGARQTPVFRGDVAGNIILADGFTPGRASGSARVALETTLREARQHLDDYQQRATGTVSEWQADGYRASCDALEPVLAWFARREQTQTALRSDPEFSSLKETLTSRLQSLATLEAGVKTRYGRIVAFLGGGTFGSVYKLEDSAKRARAMKVYHPHDLRHEEKRARFRRGYEAMRQLDHPHIVHVFEFAECPIAFTMEFVDGPNLRKFHASSLEPTDQIRILLTIAETLQHAHGRGVVHRDIKPENILMAFREVDNSWVPFLTDFDLAWFSTATQLTKDALGTVFYAAPEQLAKPSSAAAHAPATDIYAFGQLMFYLLAGSDPVPLGQADNRKALIERLDARYGRSAAETLLRLYDDCTAVDPDDRLASARKICDRLRRAARSLSQSGEINLSTQQFESELRFSLVGLDGTRVSASTLLSVSGRTRVSLTHEERRDGRLDLCAHFVPGSPFAFAGATNESMRATLNNRIDVVLADFDGALRRSGQHGSYEVYVDIPAIERTKHAIGYCTKLITRVIDAMER